MKLTLNDLIAKRMDKEKRITKEIFIKSLGGSLSFEKPSKESALTLLEASMREVTDVREFYGAFRKTIYDCCPMLRNQELQDEYGVKDPYDIVDKIFEVNEVVEIGGELAEFDNVIVEEVDEAIKNS